MATQDEIMSLERKFWQSMVNMDVDNAVSLLDEYAAAVSSRCVHHFNPSEYNMSYV